MKAPRKIRHEFVELAPKVLEEGVLYVSVEYASAVHNCFCGCGNKVVTPITPTDWRLTYDGDTVSLWPSVGNWDYPCEAHYIIERDVVRWALPMSRQEIEKGRAADQRRRDVYYGEGLSIPAPEPATRLSPVSEIPRKPSFWKRLFGGR